MKKAYERNNKLTKIQGTSCMHASLFDLGRVMISTLDKYPEILQVDKIVIENQPSLKNPTMKSIEMLLFSYFVHHNFQNVKFVSPSGKLKINDGLTKIILSKCKIAREKYEVTKELSVIYCKKLINDNTINKLELMNKLKTTPKEDDLCDAFLHAYYHMIGTGLDDKNFETETIKYFETNKDNKKKKKSNDEMNTIKL
jgi:hypothetical protein